MKEDHYDGQHDSSDFDSHGTDSNEYQDMKVEKKSSLETSAKPQVKCSHCGTIFVRSQSKVMPFCSVRCQQIDMGRWLDEEYGMPMEGQEDREFGTLEETELDEGTE